MKMQYKITNHSEEKVFSIIVIMMSIVKLRKENKKNDINLPPFM